MKRLVLLAAIAATSLAQTVNAQTPFFTRTDYIGAFGTTNWTQGWANFDPQNSTYAATNDVLEGEITSDRTLDKSKVYLLRGFVYVKNGATLTIPAGTIIRGDKATKGTLIVTRGSKLEATGTLAEPVVFTSNEPAGDRDYGDWGGIIILGNAPVNPTGGTATIEGGVNNANGDGIYGGTNADDNSGSLTYVRLEFPGIAFQPDNEINGLTMGGVGRGTTMHHIQISFCGDDAFEWFGGNVDAKYLISHRTWDDGFDCDFGYSGRVQFGIDIKDPRIADVSGSNGFEVDNDGTGSDNTPNTSAVFSNITMVGPLAQTDTTGFNSNHRRGAHLRRNTHLSIFNSVFAGYTVGILIDGDKSTVKFQNGTGEIKNTYLAGNRRQLDTAANRGAGIGFDITAWFNTTGFGNTIAAKGTELIPSYSLTNPNLVPSNGSPLLSGAAFTSAKLLPLGPGVGVEKVDFAKNLNLFPNPAQNIVNLSFNTEVASTLNLKVVDVTGKVVLNENKDLVEGSNDIELNTASLKAGIYFINMESEGKSQTIKFVVVR